MNRILKIGFLFLAIISLWFIYISLSEIIINPENNSLNYSGKNALNGEEISINDQVTVQVKRERWYGTIIQNEKNSDIYLFNFMKMPYKKGDTNLMFLNLIIFSMLLIIFITLSILILTKGGEKNELEKTS